MMTAKKRRTRKHAESREAPPQRKTSHAGRKRPRIGDIIEIPTSKGYAYALYSHEDPEMGSLVRVLPGLFEAPHPDPTALVAEKEQFCTFFELRSALWRGLVRVVANVPLPEWAVRFPMYRGGLPDRNAYVHQWYVVDGSKTWTVGKLTPELRHLPNLSFVYYEGLVYLIETGYTPEHDV